MKKILLFSLSLFNVFALYAQTIVSTSPENKNVVLEEFTGIHCGYCPQGHAIAKNIQDAHPDDVTLINIHTGSYATPGTGEPDFRTSFGDAIAGQSGLTGYPSGTVNRHVFPGSEMTTGETAMGRDKWTSASNTILGQSSYVNIALTADIDVQTRELSVYVEVYYTGNSPLNTNKLNVVLLQNNTLGPQSGGGKGDEYVHMHRLVHMITGQWGDDITNTSSGSFFSQTYTYTIPANYNGVDAVLADMEIAAFVAEGKQEIISGSRTFPTFSNFATRKNAGIEKIIIADKICGTSYAPTIKVQNKGGDTLTGISFTYNINNGTDSTYEWNGHLAPLQAEEIKLNDYTFSPQSTNSLSVKTSAVNNETDEDASDNSKSKNFGKAKAVNSKVTLTLTTDQYGSETSWRLYNSSGSIVKSGSGYGNNASYTVDFSLNLDCYNFVMKDSYGDGGATYKLKDSDGITIVSSSGNWGSKEETPFNVNKVTGIESINKQFVETKVFPNPVCNILTLEFSLSKSSKVDIELYNTAGKLIKIQSYGTLPIGKHSLDFSANDIQPGLYYLILNTENGISKKKISVIK